MLQPDASPRRAGVRPLPTTPKACADSQGSACVTGNTRGDSESRESERKPDNVDDGARAEGILIDLLLRI